MALSGRLDEIPTCQSLRVELLDTTSVGAARRACEEMARLADLSEAQRGRLGLIVTEAANNAIHYAKQGEIVLRRSRHAVDVLVLDKGPGMSNLPRCMEDGFSTGGTRGAGLGSLRRQADTFAMHSQSGKGTGIFARVGETDDKTPFCIGAVSLPIAGETLCGDAWSMHEAQNGVRLVVADGLGHGPMAAEAAHVVLDTVPVGTEDTQQQALKRMHTAAASTRGAAVAIADVPAHGGEDLAFTGVGNIGGTWLAAMGQSHSLASHNGTVGARMSRTQTFSYPCLANGMLVLYSDGLQSRWSLDAYSDLGSKHPCLIAGILYRDFSRNRDDVTVIVLKKGGD